MQPKGEFEGGAASPGQWVEVSVGGALYHLRDSRSAPQKKSQVYFYFLIVIYVFFIEEKKNPHFLFGMIYAIFKVENEFNLLVDGSLIDLCGATLLWRSAEGLAKGPVS